VIVPNVVPGVLSGAIFAFIHSWDELIVVIFIGGRALFTLPRRMWDGINDNLDPVIAVVATSMLLFTLLVLIAELSLRARRWKARRPHKGRDGPCRTIAIAWTISSGSSNGRGQGLSAPRLPRHVRRARPGTDRRQARAGDGRSERAGSGQLGGDAVRGMKNAWVDPYLKKYPDRKVAIDGTGLRPAASA